MRKLILLIVLVLFCGTLFAQKIALKNNLLYDATLTPNLAMEFALGAKTTLDLGAGYHPFDLGNDRQWKHWLAQPEFRWWFCERFNGAFVGAHALGGEYSFAKLDLPLGVFSDLRDYRYEGWYGGGGISVGYQWILGRRWSLEAAVGAGYVRVQYDKYTCAECAAKVGNGYKNYFGPTKAALSLVFFL
jgi:putative salt-induced outer membrane protein YdiY